LGLSKRESKFIGSWLKAAYNQLVLLLTPKNGTRSSLPTFKKLQEKGFIEATLERPTRFTIVPLKILLTASFNAKKMK
jgi:hypothetical protein